MRPTPWQVLDPTEVQKIDAASKEILQTIGLQMDLKRARTLLQAAGAEVDESTHVVRIPEQLIQQALTSAPRQFTVYGNDPSIQIHLGAGRTYFAGIGTPTKHIDTYTGQLRPALLDDLKRHLIMVGSILALVISRRIEADMQDQEEFVRARVDTKVGKFP